jgi:predicted RNA-binding Zn ribbon-like protein
MISTSEARPAFDLCAGHPALDLVNSLDHRFDADPRELLTDYDDLVRFAGQTGLIDAPQMRALRGAVGTAGGARALGNARELREAMASLLYGRLEERPAPRAELQILERQFHQASGHRELRWTEAGRNRAWAGPDWSWGRSTQADLPVWLLAQSASELLLSEAIDRVHACGADTCRWLFLDTSKNHTRRWCNMRVCGNRMKARRFQARR